MKEIYYGDYLNLDQLLESQRPESAETKEEHDEMLFIIVHQAYELWFKQILHELNDVHQRLNKSFVRDRDIAVCVKNLERVKKIQHVIIGHFDILETMTPMDFMEFRDMLIPASGFQSVQFRKIEIMLGLSTDTHKGIDKNYFLARLSKKDGAILSKMEKEPSLFDLMDSWLARFPFMAEDQFRFWEQYQKVVAKMLNDDEKIIQKNSHLSARQKEIQLEDISNSHKVFKTLFDEESHDKLIQSKERRLSRQATLAALFILLYREKPALLNPYRLLINLMDMDQNLTQWRYRHALLVKRMLGTKIGTGGSSGHQYLKAAADNNSVFFDLLNLSTFLIPRSQLPILPSSLEKKLLENSD